MKQAQLGVKRLALAALALAACRHSAPLAPAAFQPAAPPAQVRFVERCIRERGTRNEVDERRVTVSTEGGLIKRIGVTLLAFDSTERNERTLHPEDEHHGKPFELFRRGGAGPVVVEPQDGSDAGPPEHSLVVGIVLRSGPRLDTTLSVFDRRLAIGESIEGPDVGRTVSELGDWSEPVLPDPYTIARSFPVAQAKLTRVEGGTAFFDVTAKGTLKIKSWTIEQRFVGTISVRLADGLVTSAFLRETGVSHFPSDGKIIDEPVDSSMGCSRTYE